MAQDPLKPRDKGKIGLPPIDTAMNKLPGTAKGGGRGTKDDKDDAALGSKDQPQQDFLGKVRKRMDRCIDIESENRKNALDDLKFKQGEGQWPSDVAAQRNFDKRPCLTINKLPTFVHQITNDQRQNRPSINISPVGDKGDPEVAKMYRGLIRQIERDCAADIAYDTAFDNAVSNGFGFWRIVTEDETPDSFDQVIRIKRIRNPFTVYLDPDHQEPDGADCKYGFVTEMIDREDFKEDWPDADEVSFTQFGAGDGMKNWVNQYQLRIAEYFEVEDKKRTLVQLDNGHVGWKDDLDEDVLNQIAAGTLKVLREGEKETHKIRWYKLTALDILDERDWLGNSIPIVPVIGEEIDIEGKVKLNGIIRNAKQAQLMYNYNRTLETELVSLQPKAPWIMEEGQVEGHEQMWKTANVKNLPYLLYKATSVGGKPAPPPQRQAFSGAPAAVVQQSQLAAQDMMATTGIRFDATQNERMIDESGKAIRELRRSGDLGSFHYVDNLARSLRRTGQMLVDLIPKIYDTKRIVTILREDDSEESVQIDPAQAKPLVETRHPQTGKRLKIFNPTYGKYGVTVTIGPSYASKRIEASESMMAFAKALPQTAGLIADLIAKNQDWPGAEEMATRLAKALPPQLLTPDQKDMSPQVEAVMQQMDSQIKQLTQHTQQLMAALTEKNTDRAQKQDEIDKAFHAKMAQIEEKFSEALLKVMGKLAEPPKVTEKLVKHDA